MIEKYDIFTKDKEKISYRAFIQTILIKLGLSPTSKGTYYLRDIITLAIQEKYNFNDVTLINLIKKLATIKNLSERTIKSNIDYAFKYKNTFKAQENFESIFNIKYDEYFLTAKTITNLIINLIAIWQ